MLVRELVVALAFAIHGGREMVTQKDIRKTSHDRTVWGYASQTGAGQAGLR